MCVFFPGFLLIYWCFQPSWMNSNASLTQSQTRAHSITSTRIKCCTFSNSIIILIDTVSTENTHFVSNFSTKSNETWKIIIIISRTSYYLLRVCKWSTQFAGLIEYRSSGARFSTSSVPPPAHTLNSEEILLLFQIKYCSCIRLCTRRRSLSEHGSLLILAIIIFCSIPWARTWYSHPCYLSWLLELMASPFQSIFGPIYLYVYVCVCLSVCYNHMTRLIIIIIKFIIAISIVIKIYLYIILYSDINLRARRDRSKLKFQFRMDCTSNEY